MTRDEIIRMALAKKQNLRDRIEYAMALEREACAKHFDENSDKPYYGRHVAAAIRERGAP